MEVVLHSKISGIFFSAVLSHSFIRLQKLLVNYVAEKEKWKVKTNQEMREENYLCQRGNREFQSWPFWMEETRQGKKRGLK